MFTLTLQETLLTGLCLILFGYWLGATSVDDIERLVNGILAPLYSRFVAVYITLQIFHGLLEEPILFLLSGGKRRRQRQRPLLLPNDKTAAFPLSNKDDTKNLVPLDHHQKQQEDQDQQPFDMTGTFRLVSNDDRYEEFLAAQGVPWALRGAANRARPTHRFWHTGNKLKIQIQGIIESTTIYQIEGPPVLVQVRGRKFQDTVTYIQPKHYSKSPTDTENDSDSNTNDNGDDNNTNNNNEGYGVQTIKRALDDGYTVQVRRLLSPDKSKLTMTSTLIFDDPNKKPITTVQIFHRKPDQ